MSDMAYELVCGLEIHIELSTKTKLFCGCSTAFGAPPNTQCCPVCTAAPGALPVLNQQALEYSILASLALNCEINTRTWHDRKNYFYPDLPKSYQNSQYVFPVGVRGHIDLPSGKQIRIHQIHLEEDAGKLVHEGGDSYLDCNRCGIPLIEIVTEPDFRNAEEVRECLEFLRDTLRFTGVSDCRMQEGSMRCDVNLSVRPVGQEKLGTRVEIKNMNSINFIMQAIAYEFERQVDTLEAGGELTQDTLRFDEKTGRTISMREKSDAVDYRYFRDPDLADIRLSDEYVEELRRQIPELPYARAARYMDDYGISKPDAMAIVRSRRATEFFEAASTGLKRPKTVSDFIVTRIFRRLDTEAAREEFRIPVTTEGMNTLVRWLEEGKISSNLAKNTLEQMLDTGAPPQELLKPEDLAGANPDELRGIAREVMAEMAGAVADYRAGKEKALGALLGGIMRKTGGKADPVQARQLLLELLSASE